MDLSYPIILKCETREKPRKPQQKAFTSKVQTERPTEKNGQMEKILGEIPIFITTRG